MEDPFNVELFKRIEIPDIDNIYQRNRLHVS